MLVGSSLAALSCLYLALDPRLKVESICHIFLFKVQQMFVHTHKPSLSVWQPRCSGHGRGMQQFPTASLYGGCGCNSPAAQELCKSKGVCHVRVFAAFLWRRAWTCKIYLGVCAVAPCVHVLNPLEQSDTHLRFVPKETLLQTCVLSMGRLRKLALYPTSLLQDRRERLGASGNSRVHPVLKILLASWMVILLFKKEWSYGSKFHICFWKIWLLIFVRDCLFGETDLLVPSSFTRALVYHKVEALIKQDINLLRNETFSFPTDKLFGLSKIVMSCLILIHSRNNVIFNCFQG